MKLQSRLSVFFALAICFAAAAVFFLAAGAGAAEFSKESVLSPCSNCHSERFPDPKYNEWRNSTHKELVDAESPESPAKRDVCVGCHTAQGFAEKKTIEDRMDGGKGGTLDESHGQVVFKGKDGKPIKPESIPEAQYIAAYNYFFVHSDKSNGIHNTSYAVQLLQSSYQNLTGKPVPNAYIR